MFEFKPWMKRLPQSVWKSLQRHDTEVFVPSRPHSHGTSFFLFVAHDQDVRQLLQRVLPYFIRDFSRCAGRS